MNKKREIRLTMIRLRKEYYDLEKIAWKHRDYETVTKIRKLQAQAKSKYNFYKKMLEKMEGKEGG